MKPFDDLFAEYLRNLPLLREAKKAGVAALLLQSTHPRGLLYRHPMTLDGSLAPVPAAIVNRENFNRLARVNSSGQVRVKLKLQNKISGAYESQNVIAELRGRERPGEVVLIGAHLDSWDLGTGAEDNGANAALVLDVARAFKQLGVMGSRAYVERHRAELDKHAATVTFDTGSGRPTRFYLNGRQDLRSPLNRALSAVAAFSATGHLPDAINGTDNFDCPHLGGVKPSPLGDGFS